MMRWLRVHLAAGAVAALLLAPIGVMADVGAGEQPAERTPVATLIHDAAQRWQVDEQLMLQLARCESRLGEDPRAYWPWAAHRGVFQWNRPSWVERAPAAGVSPDWAAAFDDWANVEVTAAALASGQRWRWSCR